MITVETTETVVRVTIPKGEVPMERLNWFVESLHLEALARKNNLPEDEAAHLADHIKHDWWAAHHHLFKD